MPRRWLRPPSSRMEAFDHRNGSRPADPDEIGANALTRQRLLQYPARREMAQQGQLQPASVGERAKNVPFGGAVVRGQAFRMISTASEKESPRAVLFVERFRDRHQLVAGRSARAAPFFDANGGGRRGVVVELVLRNLPREIEG